MLTRTNRRNTTFIIWLKARAAGGEGRWHNHHTCTCGEKQRPRELPSLRLPLAAQSLHAYTYQSPATPRFRFSLCILLSLTFLLSWNIPPSNITWKRFSLILFGSVLFCCFHFLPFPEFPPLALLLLPSSPLSVPPRYNLLSLPCLHLVFPPISIPRSPNLSLLPYSSLQAPSTSQAAGPSITEAGPSTPLSSSLPTPQSPSLSPPSSLPPWSLQPLTSLVR